MIDLQECVFSSGARAHYVFSTVATTFDSDDLAALSDFSVRGPLTESLPEHAPKYREFLLSRYLLLQLLKAFKKRNVGGVACSLSHTQSAAVVAGAPTLAFEGAQLAAGLGVDLESAKRKISEAAFRRLVVSPEDKKVLPLDLWSLKEAAYKAHPRNENMLLSDFGVESFSMDEYFLRAKSGTRFEAKILRVESFKIALARLLRE